jgi:hypothetical protein
MGNDAVRLKEQFDMRAVVAESLGPPLASKHNEDMWECPFHDESSVGGFHVYKDGYHCFSCKAQGDVFDWYREYMYLNFKQTLAKLNGGEMPEGDFDPREAQRLADKRAAEQERRLKEQIETAQEALDDLRKARKWVSYHDNLNEISRDLWRLRGITDDYWIDFWKLGFNDEYKMFQKKDSEWVCVHKSPSLTIPVWGHDWNINNIKHRLIEPGAYAKYMQEKKGVKAQSFVAEPSLSSGPAIVVEGEIKAMVSFTTYDDPNMQVFGLPSATPDDYALRELANYDPLYLIMDPDTYEKKGGVVAITRLAKKLGIERVRHLRLTEKVDDMIVEYGLDKPWLRSCIAQARPM